MADYHLHQQGDEENLHVHITPETRHSLKRWNLIAGLLHMVQFILMLVASFTVQSIRDFKKPIYLYGLKFDAASKALLPDSRLVGHLWFGAATSSFLLISAVAHLYIILRFDAYIVSLRRGINPWRWIEYAISSSIMICLIAVLFGVYGLGALVLMFAINGIMNTFGLVMEKYNPPNRTSTDWLPFALGCLAGLPPWIVILFTFLGADVDYSDVPAFVYALIVVYFVFFNTFPVNMTLQYMQYGKWSDYVYGERVYITLSLVSKSILAWIVFGGTFQPN
eukprot:TRINITY_DN19697_c0_g1_i1.p1 TRINITY_DN19697_c0_g1~~TRINITY_DN19697_c0_g1_i1.p1  ORF type:complete len:279 (-),score=33.57 TRINITY_DN19697_c0_g1_i1:64-900(-)